MKRNLSIQLKAAFLLLIFSLNIVVGFACAIGIDMGFNSSHHHDENKVMAHHDSHHDEMDNDHHKSNDDNDNCCHDKVVTIAQVDKSVPQSYAGINITFATALLNSFYNTDVLSATQTIPHLNYFVRNYHPPISDIRIAIQSFQI